ncbi:MAG TPA: TerC family protein [Planctomycetota bacterium]|jgi:predicted tellurium resistance membrane protein TerC|nr:TerC family protein [Planctomycetota bacterium]
MNELLTPENGIALLTLTALEIVLGIDNIVFLSIITGGLPEEQRPLARRLGLALAMGMRILLLFAISWVMGLTAPIFHMELIDHTVTGRDLVLFGGGLFLLAKATVEIHKTLEGDDHGSHGKTRASMFAVLVQIALLDAIFSLDSVITAVGMADEIAVMIVAVVLAVGAMMIFATPVAEFVERHPTVKMLALSFLILVGVLLTAEGLGREIEKGYIYFAMAFSFAVEMLNLRIRKRSQARA